MTGTLGELGFGTQVLPVSGADIQDEKVLGTCHLATGRDDHLGGDIVPDMFKKHENSTHDDILFAPHKTPNFNIKQVRMKRGDQRGSAHREFPSVTLLDGSACQRPLKDAHGESTGHHQGRGGIASSGPSQTTGVS
ncbi:MAG: hypothetical protein QM755_01535 [Luteolibacter sp.]